MITNKQLQALLSRAKGMSKTHRDTMWEALIFVRGTYERERSARDAEIERLTQASAELAAEVERLKVEFAEAESRNWTKQMTAIVDEINADVRKLRADK
jgi:cell division protein FtsB